MAAQGYCTPLHISAGRLVQLFVEAGCFLKGSSVLGIPMVCAGSMQVSVRCVAVGLRMIGS